jgi:hypothetical protein
MQAREHSSTPTCLLVEPRSFGVEHEVLPVDADAINLLRFCGRGLHGM